ncbi:caspase-10 [Moschus berezovskii]|uniref:caspase-10 n=1 Tax=Moschus berezovskii TaxID=68408 RepID=UPI0024443FA4|nr:caspase-10 [Moschus berezovskii]
MPERSEDKVRSRQLSQDARPDRQVMASPSQRLISTLDENRQVNFQEKLLIIDLSLEDQDVECLKFLCQDYITPRKLEKCSRALDIFEYLQQQELLSEEDPLYLAELLYIIQQKVLLQHFDYTKEQVESWLQTRRRVSHFRNLLYELSEGISSENLRSMIFLLKESIPNVQMNSRSFLTYLERQAKIDEDNVTLLENLCQKIVPNLMEKLDKYKRERKFLMKIIQQLEENTYKSTEQALRSQLPLPGPPAPCCQNLGCLFSDAKQKYENSLEETEKRAAPELCPHSDCVELDLGRLCMAGHLNFGNVDVSLEFPEKVSGEEK